MTFFRWNHAALAVAALLALAGCERYQPRPLDTQRIFSDVEQRRKLLAPASPDSTNPPEAANSPQPFTFARAAALMKELSPDLREVRAAYATTLALANVKSPLPNPGLEVGPSYGFGPDVSDKYRLQPFASIGFSIPTGGRLKRQDELHRAQADRAWAEALIRHRELYLQLRSAYARMALARRRATASEQIAASAAKSTALSRRLIDAGTATALDAGLIELEQARLKTQALGTEADVNDALGALADLVGVEASVVEPFPEGALGELPAAPPALSELKTQMLNAHPALARLRADYETAERALRLEIARQYPDFKIGPSYDGENGEKKITLGLTLGIELPFFDRNQQAVAQSKQHREEVREKYEAAATRALAQLERAHRGCELAARKLSLLNGEVLPRANANIEQARRALDAGNSDALKFLETERGQRAVLLDALDAELSVREAWIALEQAVGKPLVLFPGESIEQQPPATQDASTNPVPAAGNATQEVQP
jgi:outer membrane protein, heavy metal efflux system